MKVLTFILSLVALGGALMPNGELDGGWIEFKAKYNKVYKTEEEPQRRLTWEANVQAIQIHNQQASQGLHTFTMGQNKFADITTTEFAKLMNGYRTSNRSREGSRFLPPTNVRLPETVDWRPKGYVTPVKDQAQCGSCWAFSTTGSLEGQHFRKTGQLISLSEQNLVDCSGKEGNMGCNGGLMDQAFNYIFKNNGIDNELSYPYEAVDGKCRFRVGDVSATDTGHTDVQSGSEAHLQTAAATIGPISVAIDASHQSFQLYKAGVYYESACSSSSLDHGVLVVGYGTDNGQDYWLVKNSWGSDWGLNGYLMMSRNKDNNCGIATQASYPLV